MRKQPPPWSDIYTTWRMLNRSLVPFCIYGGLGLPALVIAHIQIYLNFYEQ
nr:MAG TPA: hypothetical protein [Caudoviricetes sp.]